DSREEALTAFQSGYHASIKSPKSIKTSTAKISRTAIVPSSISVDAACSGNPGMMEYRGVMTDTGKEIFHLGPLRDGTNNIGEFLALVHVLALLKQKGREDIPIYSDSKIAIGWIKKGKANTKLEHTGHNEPIFQLIQRAERWLANNSFANPILKWETDSWGEIPADFGRK
ncbi:MAG TPA: ribonuclease H, partial [Saprospiraceae bacterium]|nr:ribonuclease H [Saprospiraceae bacterium]